jgi:hypothetical protein
LLELSAVDGLFNPNPPVDFDGLSVALEPFLALGLDFLTALVALVPDAVDGTPSLLVVGFGLTGVGVTFLTSSFAFFGSSLLPFKVLVLGLLKLDLRAPYILVLIDCYNISYSDLISSFTFFI